jgi:hypothetical protein
MGRWPATLAVAVALLACPIPHFDLDPMAALICVISELQDRAMAAMGMPLAGEFDAEVEPDKLKAFRQVHSDFPSHARGPRRARTLVMDVADCAEPQLARKLKTKQQISNYCSE